MKTKFNTILVGGVALVFLSIAAMRTDSGWLFAQTTQETSSSAPTSAGAVTPAADARRVYDVANATEFADAIGSDRIIRVKVGEYNLRDAKNVYRKHFYKPFYIVNNRSGAVPSSAKIRDCKNLRIECVDSKPAIFLSGQIILEKVSNVELVNLQIGGDGDAEYAYGSVLEISESEGVTIENTLVRNGTLGLSITKSSGIKMIKSTVSSCPSGIMNISDQSGDIVFQECTFENSDSDAGVFVDDSFKIAWKKCKFEGNTCDSDFNYGGLFMVNSSSEVKLMGGSVKNNSFHSLLLFDDSVEIIGTTISDNETIEASPDDEG